MSTHVISTPNAPQAIGPYSQAISVAMPARLVFCSGQIPLHPTTGEIIGAGEPGKSGDVRAQTEQVMQNLAAVLAAADTSFTAVVKTTIFLADLKDFAVVNEVYGRYFAASPPARATVQVAGLPRGVLVEIDAVAAVTP